MEQTVTEKAFVVPSDGDAGALMRDYRSYVDPAYREEFDEFDKMMSGMDFPHEGTLLQTTQEYLKPSLGHEGVPEGEARQLLGGNAAGMFGFDLARLQAYADAVRTAVPSEILVVPEVDLLPRGDIHKPAFFSAGV